MDSLHQYTCLILTSSLSFSLPIYFIFSQLKYSQMGGGGGWLSSCSRFFCITYSIKSPVLWIWYKDGIRPLPSFPPSAIFCSSTCFLQLPHLCIYCSLSPKALPPHTPGNAFSVFNSWLIFLFSEKQVLASSSSKRHSASEASLPLPHELLCPFYAPLLSNLLFFKHFMLFPASCLCLHSECPSF